MYALCVYIWCPHIYICVCTSLTGGNFFLHSMDRERRSACMFSRSFFTASGLLVDIFTLIQHWFNSNEWLINQLKRPGCFGSSARHINNPRCCTYINKRVCVQPRTLLCVTHMTIIMLIVTVEMIFMTYIIYKRASRLSFIIFSSFLDPIMPVRKMTRQIRRHFRKHWPDPQRGRGYGAPARRSAALQRFHWLLDARGLGKVTNERRYCFI